jgi:hypothetical protein
MKKISSTIFTPAYLPGFIQAQETVYPAKDYKGRLLITNGTVHIGNGTGFGKRHR